MPQSRYRQMAKIKLPRAKSNSGLGGIINKVANVGGKLIGDVGGKLLGTVGDVLGSGGLGDVIGGVLGLL